MLLVDEQLLDAKDVGKMLKVNSRTVIRWAEQGKLPGFRLGDLWRFRKSDIDQYIEEQIQKAKKKED